MYTPEYADPQGDVYSLKSRLRYEVPTSKLHLQHGDAAIHLAMQLGGRGQHK